LRNVLALLGLLLILYGVVAFDETTPFPGLWALFPTVGTLLIILFAIPGTWVGSFLAWRPFVLVGLISYSLYLWHQPLFAFARIVTLENVSDQLYLLLVLAAFLLAYFSYRIVESPFRNRARTNRRQILAFVCSFAVLFPSLGVLGHVQDGFIDYRLSRIDSELRNFVIDREAELAARGSVWSQTLRNSDRPFEDNALPRVLILGDSKSQDLYVALASSGSAFDGIQFRRQRLDNDCMRSLAGLDPSHVGSRPCRIELSALLERGLLGQADLIVLTNTWTAWTNTTVVDFIGSLVADEKRVVVMGTGNFNDLTSLSLVIARNGLRQDALGHYLFENIKQDARMASLDISSRVSGMPGVVYLEKLELFCDMDASTCELFDADGSPYVYDTGHVTILGAREYGRRLADRNWILEQLGIDS
jgi:hypothetical protein